jgi:hypothetical protein
MSITLSAGLRMVGIGRYMHWCPGCDEPHFFNVAQQDAHDGPTPRRFAYNGDVKEPTFSPCQHIAGARGTCHYYLTSGKLEFMGDCFHEFRNRTVDLPPFPMKPLMAQEPRA